MNKKWGFLHPDIIVEIQKAKGKPNYTEIAKKLIKQHNLISSTRTVRKIVSDYHKTVEFIIPNEGIVYPNYSPFYNPLDNEIISTITTTGTGDSIELTTEDLENMGFPKLNMPPQAKPIRSIQLPYTQGDPNNVLVIGDLHEPFCLDNYLDHCRTVQEDYKCGKVIFIGDVIDNHYSSYHETDPDGYSAGEELQRAIDRIADWYTMFPEAVVLIGNHDRMAHRKAKTAGLSATWVRDYDDVLNTPNWKFLEEYEYDDVLYIHGEGGTARTKIKKELQSIVQGHTHTQAYVEYLVGKKYRIFGMQVGCGIHREAYAMAYAKAFPKPVISCGVVLKGELPIVIPMNL